MDHKDHSCMDSLQSTNKISPTTNFINSRLYLTRICQEGRKLADVLEPIQHLHSQHCISDSFTFSNQIPNISIDPNNSFFCSFDIVNLNTNVPLDETIAIFADTLYRSNLEPECNSVSITQCTNKLNQYGERFVGFLGQRLFEITNMPLPSRFSPPGPKVDASFTQSNTYTQCWHSPVNSNATPPFFSMSLLSAPIS